MVIVDFVLFFHVFRFPYEYYPREEKRSGVDVRVSDSHKLEKDFVKRNALGGRRKRDDRLATGKACYT